MEIFRGFYAFNCNSFSVTVNAGKHELTHFQYNYKNLLWVYHLYLHFQCQPYYIDLQRNCLVFLDDLTCIKRSFCSNNKKWLLLVIYEQWIFLCVCDDIQSDHGDNLINEVVKHLGVIETSFVNSNNQWGEQ